MVNCVKKISIFIFSLLFSISLFAYDGVLSGEKVLRVLKTQWFDIIFPEDSQKSAAILYENADKIYYEIAEMYGGEPRVRMPVVLAPGVEESNAYFTDALYNHIVIYDTAEIQDLMVFSNSLLSTFRHELTHAYTFNMKGKGWSTVGRIFGEVINPAHLTITSGWAEGATMTSESASGEGRLNNEYSRQMVKQAKIENQFPKYRDVQGARDIYPSGGYYYFNGEFNQWLQDKYGMEKYAAFWYRCVNLKSITAGGAFKKVYGIKLNDAWEEFRKDLFVPEVCANPADEQEISDFFGAKRGNVSAENNRGAIYSGLTSSEKGIAYIETKSASVWYADFSRLQKGAKPKKLFTLSGVQSISLSNDGRFMAVSYRDSKHSVYKKHVKIYDMKFGTWHAPGGTGMKSGAAMRSGDDYYLVYEKFKSQDKKLAIKKIILKNGKVAGFEDESLAEVKENFEIYSFTQTDENSFVAIIKDALEWKIARLNFNGEITETYDLPYPRMVLHDLSYDKASNSLYFSWTKPSTMPRIGKFSMDSKKFELLNKDYSGGVYNPVKAGENFVYIAYLFEENRLLYLDDLFANSPEILNPTENEGANPSEDKTQEEKALADAEVGAETLETIKENPFEAITLQGDLDEILQKSTKYNPFKYYLRGLLLPLGSVTSTTYDKDSDVFAVEELLPIGFTYASTNPWSKNIILLSLGYGYDFNSFGASVAWQSGSDTDLLNYSVTGQTEFDFAGWKQANLNAGISSVIPVGKVSKLTFSESAYIGYGRGNLSYADSAEKMWTSILNEDISTVFDALKFLLKPGWRYDSTLSQFLFAESSTGVLYQMVYKTGPGLFERGGFAAGAKLDWIYDAPKTFEWQAMFLNVNPYVLVYIPKLIPVHNRKGFVYNLPTKIRMDLYPSTSKFASAKIETMLFDMEVQKGVPFMPLSFFNDFYLTGGYSTSFSFVDAETVGFIPIASAGEHFKSIADRTAPFTDYVFISLSTTMTPNFGVFASSSGTTLRIDCNIYLHKGENAGPFKIILSLNSNF